MLNKIGNKIINSTSKITNTTAIKKKWTEKYLRDNLLVENPHSNGESFPNITAVFLDTKPPKNINKTDKINLVKIIIPNISI